MTGAATAGMSTFWVTPDQLTPAEPERRESGADQAAEQCVRRAGRDAEQPGQQVPEDAADEAGEDDREPHRRVDRREQVTRLAVLHLEDRRGHGDGDLDREEGADEVQDAGEQDRGLWLESPGGDRRRHGVAGVVEPVGEVEGQCCRYQQHQDDHLCAHGANSGAIPAI